MSKKVKQSIKIEFNMTIFLKVPGNPHNVLPLPPNMPNMHGSYNNYSLPNSNNNFNRPYYDNTRTTYPPFDKSTKRPTFPTRQPYNTPPPTSRKFISITVYLTLRIILTMPAIIYSWITIIYS